MDGHLGCFQFSITDNVVISHLFTQEIATAWLSLSQDQLPLPTVYFTQNSHPSLLQTQVLNLLPLLEGCDTTIHTG